jgi:hypothetical protein
MVDMLTGTGHPVFNTYPERFEREVMPSSSQPLLARS